MDDKVKKRLLKKSIKQNYSVIRAFRYEYVFPLEEEPTEDDFKKLEKFRKDVLFALIDQTKKMELELAVVPEEIKRPLHG